MRRILVTGAAGFIGYHLCERLLKEGNEVIGVDNLNDYYDPQLKAKRLSMLIPKRGFKFVKCDISDFKVMDEVFKKNKPTHVYNLAAEAGVLYSLENPKAFGVTNLMGFLCILEMCVQHKVAHLLYASSASVYGNAGGGVSKEDDNTDHPISLYGATKKANELMAHCYGESHGLKTTGFRFFTVYGEWGRPDMAIYLFADAIKNGKPVKIYDHGKVQRDFVYVGDIVGGLVKSLVNPPQSLSAVFNIGTGESVLVADVVTELEKHLGKTAKKQLLPLPAGDISSSLCDAELLRKTVGYKAKTGIKEGLEKYCDWFKVYYK